MSRDPYIINRDSDLHLRDARHAHQLFTEHSFSLAPKVKFLYHVNFALTPEAAGLSPNSTTYNKEIGVLAKSADLPSYRASVETKNQYNRRKHIQTRVDYNEIAIRFHDDNLGLTRAMLEEYYKYYVVEGRRTDIATVNPRDKYSPTVYRYGIDNETTVPFFQYIKIFQLSRQKWFGYTLINPIITQWSHDSVDASDGQGIMENSISIAYEAVYYNNGDISQGGDPPGFSDPETRYDQVPSPLTVLSPDGIPGGNSSPPSPKLVNVRFQNEAPTIDRYSNSFSLRGSGGEAFESVEDLPGVIPQTRLPKTNTQIKSVVSSGLDRLAERLNSDAIISELNQNPNLLNTLIKRILSTGSFSSSWNSRNFNQFDDLPVSEKNSIKNNILAGIETNSKFQQLARQVITMSRSNR